MRNPAELQLIGGDPALDFVNTVEGRGDPDAEDALASAAELRAWGTRYGLIEPAAEPAAGDEDEFRQAIEARELLYALCVARIRGRPATDDQLEQLGGFAAAAYRAGRLAQPDGVVGWSWSRSELASVRHAAVISAVGLLHSDSQGRLKQCPGDHCGWLFLDTTKRGNRRWCSMRDCGQEAKDERRRIQRQRRSRAPGAQRVA